jgi:Flp pilus assembly pilin Flp
MSVNTLKSFVLSESGAVTVDWVVLTAALVGLGLAVMSVVSGGIETLSTSISTDLGAMDPMMDPFDDTNQTLPAAPADDDDT